MHLEMALNFCMEHDQHTLHNGEAQEISALAGWGVLRQHLIPPKETLRHFSETKVCCLAPLLHSLHSWKVQLGHGKGVHKVLLQVLTEYPFFLLLVACIWAACAFQRGSLLTGSALLPPTSSVQFAPFVLNIYTMKAEVRNSHHHFTAEAGTLEKSNNKTENRIFKMMSTAMKPGEESLGTSTSSLLAHPCCQGGAEAAPGSQDPV